ncbi:MAG: sporulation protein YtfJ [Firmicutes bacterium]|nr:sporulation protein YtfJ [Bacillota bacterium]
MAEHPIEGLMTTAMDSIKDMVDVNTVVGEPVEASDGSVIIPISRVAFGFAAGGGEYQSRQKGGATAAEESDLFPFAGGSGAGVSIHPVAFLVVGGGQVRLLPVDSRAFYDRLIDLAPQLIDRINTLLGAKMKTKTKAAGNDEKEINSNAAATSTYNPRGCL